MPRLKLSKRQWLILAVSGLLITTGLIIASLMTPISHKSDNSGPQVVTYSTDQPDENEPPKDYNWSGTATDPKKIIIPSIGVDAFVQQVGVDQKKQIAVPDNIHMVGWFINSVRPGQKGLSIIDGHVNGR